MKWPTHPLLLGNPTLVVLSIACILPNTWSQTPRPPAPVDPVTLVAGGEEENVIKAIGDLPQGNAEVSIPLLAYILKYAPRREGHDRIHPLRKAALERALALAPEEPEAREFLQHVLSAYAQAGSRALSVHYPFQGDREYAWVMGAVLPALVESAEPEMEDWFLSIFNTPGLHWSPRERAYRGYLRSKTLRLGTVEERVAFLLKDLTTPGTGEWDYFHHGPATGPGPLGKKEWAIKDTACCLAIAEEGTVALPLLEREWEAYELRKPLSEKQQRRQYAIAYVICQIRGNSQLQPDPGMVWAPEDAEEQYMRKLREYEDKRKALEGTKEGPLPEK